MFVLKTIHISLNILPGRQKKPIVLSIVIITSPIMTSAIRLQHTREQYTMIESKPYLENIVQLIHHKQMFEAKKSLLNLRSYPFKKPNV